MLPTAQAGLLKSWAKQGQPDSLLYQAPLAAHLYRGGLDQEHITNCPQHSPPVAEKQGVRGSQHFLQDVAAHDCSPPDQAS